jgi:hypothetical protein
MDLSDVREFLSAVGSRTSKIKTQEVLVRIDDVEYILDHPALFNVDPDDVKHMRMKIAASSLELSQRVVPLLNELAARMLQVAGKEAVRTVCSPIQQTGTDDQGNPLKPIPSEYTLPPEYQTVVGKVKAALRA